MQHDTVPMGSAFSQWESLTKDYLEGLVALRRREPGASAKMMRLAREMQECEARCGGPVYAPPPRVEAQPVAPAKSTQRQQADKQGKSLFHTIFPMRANFSTQRTCAIRNCLLRAHLHCTHSSAG